MFCKRNYKELYVTILKYHYFRKQIARYKAKKRRADLAACIPAAKIFVDLIKAQYQSCRTTFQDPYYRLDIPLKVTRYNTAWLTAVQLIAFPVTNLTPRIAGLPMFYTVTRSQLTYNIIILLSQEQREYLVNESITYTPDSTN